MPEHRSGRTSRRPYGLATQTWTEQVYGADAETGQQGLGPDGEGRGGGDGVAARGIEDGQAAEQRVEGDSDDDCSFSVDNSETGYGRAEQDQLMSEGNSLGVEEMEQLGAIAISTSCQEGDQATAAGHAQPQMPVFDEASPGLQSGDAHLAARGDGAQSGAENAHQHLMQQGDHSPRIGAPATASNPHLSYEHAGVPIPRIEVQQPYISNYYHAGQQGSDGFIPDEAENHWADRFVFPGNMFSFLPPATAPYAAAASWHGTTIDQSSELDAALGPAPEERGTATWNSGPFSQASMSMVREDTARSDVSSNGTSPSATGHSPAASSPGAFADQDTTAEEAAGPGLACEVHLPNITAAAIPDAENPASLLNPPSMDLNLETAAALLGVEADDQVARDALLFFVIGQPENSLHGITIYPEFITAGGAHTVSLLQIFKRVVRRIKRGEQCALALSACQLSFPDATVGTSTAWIYPPPAALELVESPDYRAAPGRLLDWMAPSSPGAQLRDFDIASCVVDLETFSFIADVCQDNKMQSAKIADLFVVYIVLPPTAVGIRSSGIVSQPRTSTDQCPQNTPAAYLEHRYGEWTAALALMCSEHRSYGKASAFHASYRARAYSQIASDLALDVRAVAPGRAGHRSTTRVWVAGSLTVSNDDVAKWLGLQSFRSLTNDRRRLDKVALLAGRLQSTQLRSREEDKLLRACTELLDAHPRAGGLTASEMESDTYRWSGRALTEMLAAHFSSTV